MNWSFSLWDFGGSWASISHWQRRQVYLVHRVACVSRFLSSLITNTISVKAFSALITRNDFILSFAEHQSKTDRNFSLQLHYCIIWCSWLRICQWWKIYIYMMPMVALNCLIFSFFKNGVYKPINTWIQSFDMTILNFLSIKILD